ncbi:hypothetical protein KAR91_43505 [Candidatus Pacearchaeota archaeon]|nr:hypothetical protein [Candidatus Pacearchaeota archaeon]
MKALRPSLREKKRYLHVKGKNLKKNIPASILGLLGALGYSSIGLNFIKGDKSFSIISINREALDKVRASFCVNKDKIEVVKVSGTLKGLGFSANVKK